MYLLGCTDQILLDDGIPVCTGEWVPYVSTISLNAAAYRELWHWALLLLVTAGCIKLVKNLILNR